MHVARAFPVEPLSHHLEVVFEVQLGEDEGHFEFGETFWLRGDGLVCVCVKVEDDGSMRKRKRKEKVCGTRKKIWTVDG